MSTAWDGLETFTINEEGGTGRFYARRHRETDSFYGVSIDPESDRPPAWFQFPAKSDGTPDLNAGASIPADRVPAGGRQWLTEDWSAEATP